MTALGWVLLAAVGLAAVLRLTRPRPIALDDLADAVGVLHHGGWHDDLPLTVRERLDQIRQLENDYARSY